MFVVGEGSDAVDSGASDVLSVPVGEQLLMRKVGGGRRKTGVAKKIRGVTSYSTYSLYLKTMRFLRFASARSEATICCIS